MRAAYGGQAANATAPNSTNRKRLVVCDRLTCLCTTTAAVIRVGRCREGGARRGSGDHRGRGRGCRGRSRRRRVGRCCRRGRCRNGSGRCCGLLRDTAPAPAALSWGCGVAVGVGVGVDVGLGVDVGVGAVIGAVVGIGVGVGVGVGLTVGVAVAVGATVTLAGKGTDLGPDVELRLDGAIRGDPEQLHRRQPDLRRAGSDGQLNPDLLNEGERRDQRLGGGHGGHQRNGGQQQQRPGRRQSGRLRLGRRRGGWQ